jgi:hypothetical protein
MTHHTPLITVLARIPLREPASSAGDHFLSVFICPSVVKTQFSRIVPAWRRWRERRAAKSPETILAVRRASRYLPA